MTQIYVENTVETEALPDGLRRRDTATHRFCFNCNAFLITHGETTIPAAGVHWKSL